MDFLLEHLPTVSCEQLKEFGWNAEDRSDNMLVIADPLRVHRRPMANSTDGIRGSKGLSAGLHIWELRWPKHQRGTYAAVGVGTAKAELHSEGYCPLMGADEHSFGWDIVARKCRHNGQEWDYPRGKGKRAKTVPDRLFCILDMYKGTLAFATQNEHLGIAFRGLEGLQLFPMVAAVWGHAEIGLHYMGSAERVNLTPSPLGHMCRLRIRDELQSRPRRQLLGPQLGLPSVMVDFLLSC